MQGLGFARPPAGASDSPTPHLYIANSHGLSIHSIASAFSTFGPIAAVHPADPSNTRLIISFNNPLHAQAARQAWNRNPCPQLHNHQLLIEFAVPRTPSKSHLPEQPRTSLTSQELNIPGLTLLPDFISPEQELRLLEEVDSRAWQALAKRRVQHYGYEFLYKLRNVDTTKSLGELPAFLEPVLDKLHSLPELRSSPEITSPFDQVTVNEYPAGVGLSPHIDTHSAFQGSIISLSLAGACVMEFRRYSSSSSSRLLDRKVLLLPRRSLLMLSGESRYAWQHYIPHRKIDTVAEQPVHREARRVSFTFRRVRHGPCTCAYREFCDSQAGDHSAGVVGDGEHQPEDGEQADDDVFEPADVKENHLPEVDDQRFLARVAFAVDGDVRTRFPVGLTQSSVPRAAGEGLAAEQAFAADGDGVEGRSPVGVIDKNQSSKPPAAGDVNQGPEAFAGYEVGAEERFAVGVTDKNQILEPGEGLAAKPASPDHPEAFAAGGDGTEEKSPLAVIDKNQTPEPRAAGEEDDESLTTPEIEKRFVHKVYDAIAPHFSSTRFAKWPRVASFLDSLPPASLVLDSGCGNGKYLGFNPACSFLGCDISPSLISICSRRGHEVFVGDAVNLPFRAGLFDAAISIAVLHHLSNDQRRRRAIAELLRVVKKGGRVLITVWAAEQEDKSPRNNNSEKPSPALESIDETETSEEEQQEYFVPWHLPYHRAEIAASQQAVASGFARKDDKKSAVVYNRYYHVFVRGELERLVSSLPGAEMIEAFFDKSNWCVVLRRL